MIKTNKTDIVHFFLNLFKIQQNALSLPCKYECLSPADEEGDLIYELQIHRQGQQISRRVTIGPLGEDSGSKSKCFKVIYDEILVVKIPPTSVKDFHTYIQSIDSEKKITDILSPFVECVIPSVSAILKKIKPFSEDSILDSGVFEDRCIEKLKTFGNFQNYLKIRDSYAFFMNLSTYSFLGQVIKDMHFMQDRMYKEVLSQVEMLEYPGLFEDIYGADDTLLFYRISEIYILFEEKLNPLLKKYKLSSIPSYDKKEWFLTHLAAKEIINKQDHLSEFTNELNELLKKIITKNIDMVQHYRKIIKMHIYNTKFKQIKSWIEGLIINLISLLAILRQSGIAIRDLKPDNVFVVGDLSKNPHLLSSPDEYSIGLIDFETSVNFKPEPGNKIAQPMLAGTPSYATPSHLFKNELLTQVYGDISRILHLQDWQAVNSMIFNVITGSRLTNETGRLIPGIARTIKKTPKQSMDNPEVYNNCNKAFWNKANDEFQEKMLMYKPILKTAKIIIPENARLMFNEEAQILQSEISEKIKKLVYGQKLFSSAKSREDLLNASYKKIKLYKVNWEQGKNIPKLNPLIRKQVVIFFNNLKNLKHESVQIANFTKLTQQDKVVLSAYNLMSFIFNVVMSSMYQDSWKIKYKSSSKAESVKNNSKTKISSEENIAIESTIV